MASNNPMTRKTLFAILGLSMIVLTALTQTLLPDGKNSTIIFKIKNFGNTVEGSFTGLQGSIRFDPNNPSKAYFDVSIDANSVDTGIGMRDNHLRKKDYLDVKSYPRIRFVSSKVSTSEITGILTIKNSSREVSFPFTNRIVNGNLVFKGQFQINRRDFDVGGSSISMSDNLTVVLTVTAKK